MIVVVNSEHLKLEYTCFDRGFVSTSLAFARVAIWIKFQTMILVNYINLILLFAYAIFVKAHFLAISLGLNFLAPPFSFQLIFYHFMITIYHFVFAIYHSMSVIFHFTSTIYHLVPVIYHFDLFFIISFELKVVQLRPPTTPPYSSNLYFISN
jgi:hypothetical protein